MRVLVVAMLFSAGLAGAEPPRGTSADGTPLARGQWVRVTTGAEVAGDGFSMTLAETQGRLLSRDKRTATFDVNGSRVRVPRPRTTFEGRIHATGPQALVLARTDGRDSILVPRSAISSVDVRRRGSRRFAWTAIGAFAGGAVGYASERCQPGGFIDLCGSMKAAATFVGALGGAAVGFLVAPRARWEKDVPFERLQVSIGPARGRGVGVSVSVGF